MISPENDVRDDLARIVLAINPNFIVTASDPSHFLAGKDASRRFDLAVLHDCSDAGVNAAARLFIFPEPWLERSKRPPLVPVVSTVNMAELQAREGAGTLGNSVLLGPSRVIELPGWMDPIASGGAAGGHESFPLAAAGRNADGEVGVITFDIRNHLLLDPDRMDALVLTIDTLRRLAAPPDIKIVASGAFVPISTFAPARLMAPDGSKQTLIADQWGRVRFRPLQAGRYTVNANGRAVEIFANYYDAAESDLTAPGPAQDHDHETTSKTSLRSEIHVEPAALVLIAVALFFLLAESVLLARRASLWGARHV
jgi:hypothetical protein